MAFYPLLIHRLLLPVCCFRRGSVVLVGVPRYVLVTSSLMSPMVPAVLAYADCILVQPIFPFQHVDRVMFKWCSSVLHGLGDRVLTAFSCTASVGTESHHMNSCSPGAMSLPAV